jgi:ATP-dependent Clp protease ATP-binding subunit ClpA
MEMINMKMQKCSVCKKNLAVIYTTKIVDGKSELYGLCLDCAKKMGLPVIDQLMKQTGMSPNEIENLSAQMNTMFQNMDMDDLESNEMFMKMMSMGTETFNLGNRESLGDELEDVLGDELGENKSLGAEDKKTDSQPNKKQKKKARETKHLDTYGTNLTNEAKQGKIDRIIGRNLEMDRVVQILNRRNKNNPVLIGESGVGKTAIAEGLAVRINEKQVPAKLFGTEIYLLDMTAIVAGTQFRGQFESRMKAIIKEAEELGNVVLVIDELHNIMGAGEVHGGVMNAANILKPSLARGGIQIIGATTLDEYRKHIEKDAALERRFQPVLVEEPSIDDSIEILMGIKSYYEEYHKVKISEEIVRKAVNLSERYITDRFLPDKAIDVIDEAGSRANLKNKGIVELQFLKESLANLHERMEDAATIENYEKAAEFKAEECKLLEKIKDMDEKSSNIEITVDDIGYVIEAWTKVPVRSVTENEAEKLMKLEERLHKRVIGQNVAVESVSKAIRRNRLGFRKRKKPASFIFVGPTGVGKTELVRALSVELFGSEEALIRLDMSEYMEKHTVSKLIGAPPGYIGYDQGGQLTERVRRKPYSVILLDEIEKAHSDIFNMLLQILEDGRLTDSQGRTVNFENTVIIMTSNAGTELKSAGIGFEKSGDSAEEEKIKDALEKIFRPEFLNRVDEIIIFAKLSVEQLKKILELMLAEVSGEISEKGIKFKVSQSVRDFLIEKGYNDKYGARPLRRAVQKHIEDVLAESYLIGELDNKTVIEIDMKDGIPSIVN